MLLRCIMDKSLYEMIFKRKSFHLFRNIGKEKISTSELKEIEKTISKLKPLDGKIKTKIKIVKYGVTCKRGQEYCILFYSEKKDNYLQNIGYLGEQLELYLVSKDIGTLWFGIGKVEEKQVDGLDFVIMMAIAKVDSPLKFRKDMYKSKRKSVSEIWEGNSYLDIADIVRFAPSACNTQPWKVIAKKGELAVYRYRKAGKRGIMPKNMVIYYNQIDIGIFLYFLELCFTHNHLKYNRVIYTEKNLEDEDNLVAIYTIK